MAKLVLSAGDAVLRQVVVDGERITLGRDPRNAVVVDDPLVSRGHAAIVTVGNDHIIEDLGSANGTLVNGKPVSRHILQHGDVVALGRHNLRYLNLRAAGADLERTMLIDGLASAPGDGAAGGVEPALPARTAKPRLPRARAMMMRGHRSGSVIELDRVVFTFGKPGRAVAVVTRRPTGYFVTRVEGRRRPRVNGRPIGDDPVPLASGDRLEAGGEKLEFLLE
jgi:pSer/pThr/pTyr-binding forkhead associated (FHA) protein